MKKILSMILVLTMVLSLGCVAFADDASFRNTQFGSVINGIVEMVVQKKTSPAATMASLIGTAIDVASGNITAEQIQEEVNVLPNSVTYESTNNYQHYVQIRNSDGEVLLQKAEAHEFALDGVCSKCGHVFGMQDHVHTADHVSFKCLNSGFHAVQVVCYCGEVINIEDYEHHIMQNGVCVKCGYGAQEEEEKEEKNDNKYPQKIAEGEFEGNNYIIYYYPDVTWKMANKLAEQAGGHLVAINSAEEQAFLEGLNKTGLNLWIGALRVEASWTWVNGDEWGYENWADTQPVAAELCIYGAMMPAFWYNLENDGNGEVDGYIVEFENGSYGTVVEENVTGAEAASVQESKPTGEMTLAVSGSIEDIELAIPTHEAETPAWLYIVCAVAAMALAGGVVVLAANKKKD